MTSREPSRAGDARAARRARERGASLTFITVATAVMIISLATVYLTGAQDAYKLTAFRAREAQVLAAADGALAEAIFRLEQNRSQALDFASARDGTKIQVTSTAGPEAQVTVIATGGGDERAPIVRRLVATIDLGPSGALRVMRVRRE